MVMPSWFYITEQNSQKLLLNGFLFVTKVTNNVGAENFPPAEIMQSDKLTCIYHTNMLQDKLASELCIQLHLL